VVVPHLHFMALASAADEPELFLLSQAFSDWTTTGSHRASLEFERLCRGFCLEPATKPGPLGKLGIQVRTNPDLEPDYVPQFAEED
jgi:hypothetical protein